MNMNLSSLSFQDHVRMSFDFSHNRFTQGNASYDKSETLQNIFDRLPTPLIHSIKGKPTTEVSRLKHPLLVENTRQITLPQPNIKMTWALVGYCNNIANVINSIEQYTLLRDQLVDKLSPPHDLYRKFGFHKRKGCSMEVIKANIISEDSDNLLEQYEYEYCAKFGQFHIVVIRNKNIEMFPVRTDYESIIKDKTILVDYRNCTVFKIDKDLVNSYIYKSLGELPDLDTMKLDRIKSFAKLFNIHTTGIKKADLLIAIKMFQAAFLQTDQGCQKETL